jgi:hypothetical protein
MAVKLPHSNKALQTLSLFILFSFCPAYSAPSLGIFPCKEFTQVSAESLGSDSNHRIKKNGLSPAEYRAQTVQAS